MGAAKAGSTGVQVVEFGLALLTVKAAVDAGEGVALTREQAAALLWGVRALKRPPEK